MGMFPSPRGTRYDGGGGCRILRTVRCLGDRGPGHNRPKEGLLPVGSTWLPVCQARGPGRLCPCLESTMDAPSRRYTSAKFRAFARAAAAGVILIGGLVLAGWAFDVGMLKRIVPGMIAMNPGGTALAFLLAGASLWMRTGP